MESADLLAFFQYLLKAIGTLLAIMNPFYVIPSFLAVTSEYSPDERRELALRSVRYAFFILVLFLLLGKVIFLAFGITITAFQLGGGILMLLIALRMYFGPDSSDTQRKRLQQAEERQDDIALVPLAIPVIAGPGSITTVLALKSAAPELHYEIAVFIAILLACGVVYLVFRKSKIIYGGLGKMGLNAITKIMAIILVVVSVQIFLSGLESLFPGVMVL